MVEHRVSLKKIFRNRFVLTTIPTVIALGLTGCSSKGTNNNSDFSSSTSSYLSDEREVNTSDTDKSDEVVISSDSYSPLQPYGSDLESDISSNKNLDYSGIEVSFTSEDVESVIKNIKDIKVVYYFKDIINPKASLDKYYKMKEYDSKHELIYIKDNKIDSELLKKKIISNNNNFMKDSSNPHYTELTGTNFDTAFNAMVDITNKLLNEDIDIYELDDKFDDLKLLACDDADNGLYNDDKTLLAINMTDVANISNPLALEMITKHETVHFVQGYSKTEKKNEGYKTNLGISYVWDDLDLNALGYQWLVEASAEQIMRLDNPSDYTSTSYEYMIDAIDGMELCNCYYDDFNLKTLPLIATQSDLDKLFNLYKCETEDEKIELIYFLYSMDIILNNRNSEFPILYEKKFGENYTYFNYTEIINNKCGESLNKYFYCGLLDGLTGKDESLSNIFYMIRTYELYINSLTKVGLHNEEYQMAFYNNYSCVQKLFFDLLASKTGLSVNDIYDMYSSYCRESDVTFDSINLSEEKKEFIRSIYTKNNLGYLSDSLEKVKGLT